MIPIIPIMLEYQNNLKRKEQESNLRSFYTQPLSRRCPRPTGLFPIKVLNGLQNLNDELFFGVVVLAKQYPHL